MEQTSSRIALTGYLVTLLKMTPANIIDKVTYLIQGKLYPDYEGIEMGVAEKMVLRAIATSSGKDVSEIERTTTSNRKKVGIEEKQEEERGGTTTTTTTTTKKSSRSADEVVTYAEYEYELKEIDAQDNKVLIGPAWLTRFERARITGARSLQLSLGAPPLVKVPEHAASSIAVAVEEIEQKALPISIRRILPSGTYQDISIDWLK